MSHHVMKLMIRIDLMPLPAKIAIAVAVNSAIVGAAYLAL